jgi:AcrR family transcriptional regulator
MGLPAASVPRRGGRGARERILTAAASLFLRDGIHATGVERLTQTAHVSKRTFYQHFRSKTDLVAEYLRQLDDAGGVDSERVLLDTDRTARDRLLAIFDEAGMTERMRGCPFHNAAVESAGAMPAVDAVVHAHKRAFTERLVSAAAEAGASDPDRLARQLAVLFEGAAALATSLNDRTAVHDARSAAQLLIDIATRPSRCRGPRT